MSKAVVAAIDLGAESGRVATAEFDGQHLALEVYHRFPNAARSVDGILRWDQAGLSQEIISGLAKAGSCYNHIASVGADTWGLDYGLYGANGSLLDDPSCYRDPRNVKQFRRALDVLGPAHLYSATGIQLNEINSLYSLMDDAQNHPERLSKARNLLMMPDVFHHMLSGSTVTEFSIASTTGFFDMTTKEWALPLLEELGIPTHMLPEVAMAGTDVGALLPEYRSGGLAKTRVTLPPGHDTASAVAAIPFRGPNEAFISSGTWSLVGAVVERPLINEATRIANLTNEGGYLGDIRLLNNVMGLWILQSCRRQWAAEGTDLDYATLAQLAAAERPLRTIINPNAVDFLAPGDMPARIREYCIRNNLHVPESIPAMARCIIDSLALGYRNSLFQISAVTGQPITTINVVGGGINNALLQQATADATGIPVRCGAVEATALGNAGTQLIALGEIANLSELRDVVSSNFEGQTYDPHPDPRWEEAAADFDRLHILDLARRGLSND